jgi:hypothetical protein
MTAPTDAAGVYCPPPESSGTDAEIGVAFSGRSGPPSAPYFLGLPLFRLPSPLPAAATVTAATAAAAGGGAGGVASVVVSGAGGEAVAGVSVTVSMPNST